MTSLIWFTVGVIVGLYTAQIRDGLAYIITKALYRSYIPGKVLRQDIEWAWTFHRMRSLLGAKE